MTSPALSYILVAPYTFDDVRTTLEYVRRQSICDQIELILVTSASQPFIVDEPIVRDFHSVKIVPLPQITSIGMANAVGVQHASAPVTIFGEDHAFPQPGWAQAILDAYDTDTDYAAVGPRVLNGNPGSLLSWADFLLGYGKWMNPSARGEIDMLPGHNSSYRREVLLTYGDRLAAFLESEAVLHDDLRVHGHRLYLQADATIRHVNYSRFSAWITASFYNGQVYAGTRSKNWSLAKRIVYTLGAVLIPFIRYKRCIDEIRLAPEVTTLLTRLAPILFFDFIVSSTGEMVGYALGVGKGVEVLRRYEFLRNKYVRDADKPLWTIPSGSQ